MDLAPFQIKKEGNKAFIFRRDTGKCFTPLDATETNLKILRKLRNKANSEFALSSLGIF